MIEVRGLDTDPGTPTPPEQETAPAEVLAVAAPDEPPRPRLLPGRPGPRLARPTLPPVVAARVQRDLERHYLDRSLRRLR